MVVQTLIRTGEYHDSVALMLMARELGALPHVSAVSVLMGTPANKGILQQAGLLTEEAEAAGPNDLLIIVKADNDTNVRTALAKAEQLLSQEPEAQGAGRLSSSIPARPRSIRSAARLAPAANLAVISVPGPYAAALAWDALRAGLHVLLFSDHVALEDEIALKTFSRDHGLLLMGPGAGTAIVNGIGLGFANAVPRGPVGVVAAAGTGLQEVTTLLAKAGVGISQAIGVGGRDVSEAVGGIMMLEGLRALQCDLETRVIVVVSKIGSPAVMEKIVSQCKSDKPTVLALMGAESSGAGDQPYIAPDLREAAAVAAALARGQDAGAVTRHLAAEDRALAAKARTLRRRLGPRQRCVRGLYSGGTLCEEAQRLWQAKLGQVWSNAPLDPRFKLADSAKSKRHTAIDLGEEEFTVGTPHPMIDNRTRIQRLLQEARDPSVAVILLDVVLGYGAHSDPAAELGPAIVQARQMAAAKGRTLTVVTSITGTEQDPQGLARQTAALQKAGAIVMGSHTAAAKLASLIVE